MRRIELISNGTSIPLDITPQNPNLATINLGNLFHEGPANLVNEIYRAIGGRNATGQFADQGLYDIREQDLILA